MKRAKYIAMVIIGILAAAGALVAYRFNLSVLGGGLMGGGMVSLIIGLSRLFSKKAAKDAEIEETDERNKTILHMAYYYSGQIVMWVLSMGVVVFGQLGDYKVMGILFAVLVVQFISMLVAREVLKRKM